MNLLQADPEILQKDHKTEEPTPVRRVCFVCTGNTCRSPMAAAVANALACEPIQKLPESIRSLASPELEAFSAGLGAIEGDPIAKNAVSALETAGIPVVPGHDYHTHTAHQLCGEEADRFDLLIGLTREHAFSMMLSFPHLAQKIVSLPSDISDPYGGDEKTYRLCLEQISKAVRELLFPTRPEV